MPHNAFFWHLRKLISKGTSGESTGDPSGDSGFYILPESTPDQPQPYLLLQDLKDVH